jgi:hypothetical protein
MPTMTRFPKQKSFRAAAFLWLAVASFSAASVGTAFAEDNPSPAPPAAAAPSTPQQPAPADKGFLHQMKVWWDSTITFFDKGVKDTRGTLADFGKKSGDTAKGAAQGAAAVTQDAMQKTIDASKGAATAIVRLPNTRVVEVHAPCEKAPNGAPDCVTAATNACRDKGFGAGKPLDVSTAEKCDTTQAWLAGHSPGKGECAIESWITRAVCQ